MDEYYSSYFKEGLRNIKYAIIILSPLSPPLIDIFFLKSQNTELKTVAKIIHRIIV